MGSSVRVNRSSKSSIIKLTHGRAKGLKHDCLFGPVVKF